MIRAFSFAKDICGLLYITLRGWYGYFNVNSPFVLCYYSIFEMRSSQICKNDRENLHVILHLHLDSTNGWMRNTALMPKSSLWSEMPSLKNMTSSLTPTAGRMIIKPFASPALGVFLLSIAKGQLVGWLVPQAQSKAREVPTSILTICHITWRRTNLAARH